MGYAIDYNLETGQCLSITEDIFGASDDFYTDVYPEAGPLTNYYIEDGELVYHNPPEIDTDEEDVDEDYTPSVVLDSDTDVSELEDRGIGLGGVGSNAAADSSGGDVSQNVTDVDVTGGGTLCRIALPKSEWATRTYENKSRYVFAILSEQITQSTVLHVLSINRSALATDIIWYSQEGRVLFVTDELPNGDIIINGVLMETGDNWSAAGKIESIPQSSWKCIHYEVDVASGNDIIIPAGRSKKLVTPLDFSAAKLLFVTPEWTGGRNVVIPNFYLEANSTKSGQLCATLTNLGSASVRIENLKFMIAYSGELSGITEEQEAEASLGNYTASLDYITTADIDDIT